MDICAITMTYEGFHVNLIDEEISLVTMQTEREFGKPCRQLEKE